MTFASPSPSQPASQPASQPTRPQGYQPGFRTSVATPASVGSADPIPGLRRLLVAGTAGGIGTTTVAALLFAELREAGDAPFLIDHTGGVLGPRIPGGDEVASLDHRFRLHDLGRNIDAAVAELRDPGVMLIMVTAATPLGRTLAAEQLRRIPAPAQIAVVQVECFGRRGRRPVPTAQVPTEQQTPILGQVLLPLDDVLAAGGRIPYNRLARPTRQAIRRLIAVVRPDLAR